MCIVARSLLLFAGIAAATGPTAADWVEFVNESSARLSGPPGHTSHDSAQKVFAWGDVDRDGDADLVVVRKHPIDPGPMANVLFVNEDGVLTDRTAAFAVDSSVPGDLGFLTPTDDLFAILVDVDLDGWLDVVTAVSWGGVSPQHIGYPRVYRNKGCSGACAGTDDWLGFRYEDSRIPSMLNDAGQAGFNPCFTHVDAGDVNGDGYPDLWFVDINYGFNGCLNNDFNSKLLLNQAAASPGHFVDVTETAFTGGFQISNANSGGVADLNGDGLNDLVRQDTGEIEIGYNTGDGPFAVNPNVAVGSIYYSSLGDLNNDGLLDIVTSRDDADGYLLNVGNGADGFADFIAESFVFSHTGQGNAAHDDGFAGNNIVADLDNDGWDDVLVTDVDFSVVGCDRRMHIYRNQGGTPGAIVLLEESTTGSGCQNFQGNPSTCVVASIPASRLTGVHDVAVFDIDGDGWNDLVIGRCNSTELYINQPPASAAGSIAHAGAPREQLQIGKRDSRSLTLDWGESCSIDDSDYAIYVGALGTFDGHEPLTCSTGGGSSQSVSIPAGDVYFLVAPHNGIVEGSLGVDAQGGQRPQGPLNCLPRYVSPCP